MDIKLNMKIPLIGRGFIGGGLKSTQQKFDRQLQCEKKVEFFEKQKENLKKMDSDSLEAIERKLEMFHTYEDEIAAAKQKYNNEQMWHVMDEARERGEEIAEAAEEMEPKTAEERLEEVAEEALEADENKGELTESMEEISDMAEELTEEMIETVEKTAEQIAEIQDKNNIQAASKEIMETEIQKVIQYKKFDTYI